ncbi:MAG: sulfotransferase [Pseudomonadota bacterium]
MNPEAPAQETHSPVQAASNEGIVAMGEFNGSSNAVEAAPAVAPAIFIAGASRSGTTLMSFVMRRHPLVAGLKELQYFGEFFTPGAPVRQLGEAEAIKIVATLFARQEQGILRGRPNPENFAEALRFVRGLEVDQLRSDTLFSAVVAHMAQALDKPIPCEQTPRNIFYVQELLKLYPQARFIVMVRDPRAVLASQKMRWRRRKLASAESRVPLRESIRARINYHPLTMARLWNRAQERLRQVADDPRVLTVRFEDLLTEPEATIRAICAHCEIEFEPDMLEIEQVNSSHESSGSQKGFNRKTAEAWQKLLEPAELGVINGRCHRGMRQHGYLTSEEQQAAADAPESLRPKLTYLLHLAGVVAINPRRAWIQLKGLRGRAGSQKPAP